DGTPPASSDDIVRVNPPINLAPAISNLTFPDNVFLPSNTATFTANVTDDGLPNGTLARQWVQLNGPLPVTISAPGAQTTQVTFPVAGIYTFQLTASDSQLTTVQGFSVQVFANQQPQVSVTAAPSTVYLPAGATLTANVQDDGLPSGQLLYSWTQISGPAPAMIATPNAAVTQANF